MEKKSTPSFKETKFGNYYEKYMFFIGCVGQSLFYLQAFKIFVSKSALDVSLLGFTGGFISVSSWLVYGLLLKNKVLIAANVIAVVGAALVIIGILLYGSS